MEGDSTGSFSTSGSCVFYAPLATTNIETQSNNLVTTGPIRVMRIASNSLGESFISNQEGSVVLPKFLYQRASVTSYYDIPKLVISTNGGANDYDWAYNGTRWVGIQGNSTNNVVTGAGQFIIAPATLPS